MIFICYSIKLLLFNRIVELDMRSGYQQLDKKWMHIEMRYIKIRYVDQFPSKVQFNEEHESKSDQ